MPYLMAMLCGALGALAGVAGMLLVWRLRDPAVVRAWPLKRRLLRLAALTPAASAADAARRRSRPYR